MAMLSIDLLYFLWTSVDLVNSWRSSLIGMDEYQVLLCVHIYWRDLELFRLLTLKGTTIAFISCVPLQRYSHDN